MVRNGVAGLELRGKLQVLLQNKRQEVEGL